MRLLDVGGQLQHEFFSCVRANQEVDDTAFDADCEFIEAIFRRLQVAEFRLIAPVHNLSFESDWAEAVCLIA